MPVTSFAGQPVGNGKAGTLTRNLMKAYRELVRNETRRLNNQPIVVLSNSLHLSLRKEMNHPSF